MPKDSERPCRIRLDADGPILVEGPVEVVLPDGSVVSSPRFQVALCACRRSRSYPWCDTSHRRRTRGNDRRNSPERPPRPGSPPAAGTEEAP
ncbi:CDGSH iron-sulfur domain-containing protein [Streptomyces xiamenensis]|uniref:CDGSH iron-sulfur domain-containing protein n=1 Tax=Streptomyces xiamenensis TaxID=408015 RepID=UPI0036EEC356